MDSKPSDGRQESKSIIPVPLARSDTVSLTDIDTQDTTYRITTCNQMEDLLDTIPSLGLLHPPVLIENTSGYAVVSGFRRIAACRQLGWKSVSARIHSADQDRFQIAQLAIADNSLQRPLNLIETSRALNLLMDTSPNRQQLEKAALALGLPVNPSMVMKVQQLCRLAIPIQEGILSDTISLSMALELGKVDAKDAEMLVALFNRLQLGLNKQRELLLLVSEIAKREDISIQQLIDELDHLSNMLRFWGQQVDYERLQREDLVDVNHILHEALTFMKADLFFKHQVSTELRLQEDLPMVYGSELAFAGSFGALLENAVEAMRHSDERHLVVVSKREDLQVLVEIEDSGCGLTEELGDLSSPFFPNKRSRRETNTGFQFHTGLGLCLAHHLLKPYGGDITWESRPGKSVFRVHLPIRGKNSS